MTGVNRETIGKLLVRVGAGCANLLDEKMVDLGCERLELDELWSFVGKKQKHINKTDDESRVGDMWVYVAIDADTKLIPSFLVGKREATNTNAFVAFVAARLRFVAEREKQIVANLERADCAGRNKPKSSLPSCGRRVSDRQCVVRNANPLTYNPDGGLLALSPR